MKKVLFSGLLAAALAFSMSVPAAAAAKKAKAEAADGGPLPALACIISLGTAKHCGAKSADAGKSAKAGKKSSKKSKKG